MRNVVLAKISVMRTGVGNDRLDVAGCVGSESRRGLERVMSGAKIVVLYLRPTDVDSFEHADEAHPAVEGEDWRGHEVQPHYGLRALGSEPSYHRVTEVHFESTEALLAGASTSGT